MSWYAEAVFICWGRWGRGGGPCCHLCAGAHPWGGVRGTCPNPICPLVPPTLGSWERPLNTTRVWMGGRARWFHPCLQICAKPCTRVPSSILWLRKQAPVACLRSSGCSRAGGSTAFSPQQAPGSRPQVFLQPLPLLPTSCTWSRSCALQGQAKEKQSYSPTWVKGFSFGNNL